MSEQKENQINCPVCEREIEIQADKTCPVCETDLSILVDFQALRHERTHLRNGIRSWRTIAIILILFLGGLSYFFASNLNSKEPEPQIMEIPVTVIVSATSLPETEIPPTNTLEPTQIPTHTDTPIPTVFNPPVLLALTNMHCRQGPSSDFRIAAYLYAGQQADVLAALEIGDWWLVKNPQSPQTACWVWGGAVKIQGDIDNLPSLLPPP